MSDKFCNKVRKFTTDNNLAGSHGDTIIVGLSGGADSVALLSVMLELGYECVATHCNFHLRGNESMRDENFCRELCRELSVELLTVDFDVSERCRHTGESVEMACRELRYDWWNGLINKGIGNLIAVGHHREDNVETFFLNLLRGSGLVGLKGMQPRSLNIIRPLLDTTKAEIISYLESRGLKYVTDSTNSSNEFKRNRLRNIVLPEFEQAFPGAMDAIATSISYLYDNYKLYSDYKAELQKKYVSADGTVNINEIVASEKNARMVLFEILSNAGVNMTQVDNILASINGQGACNVSGKLFHAQSVSYLLNRGLLIPVDNLENESCESVDIFKHPFQIEKFTHDAFERLRATKSFRRDAVYLDGRVLDGNPVFELRSWRKGDRFTPFGMKGSKLVSDLLSDAKLSLADKRNVRILTRNGDILWVVGLRAANLYTVGKNTSEIICLTYDFHNL
ncbi:MAG: tRNA lysidine(34) synthetase TilS [Duncaniella sp.]|nr:tRNA lysidine(34) synthetase TilS [Duncaniella sp.]